MADNAGTATIDNDISDARVRELVEIEISAKSKQRASLRMHIQYTCLKFSLNLHKTTLSYLKLQFMLFL